MNNPFKNIQKYGINKQGRNPLARASASNHNPNTGGSGMTDNSQYRDSSPKDNLEIIRIDIAAEKAKAEAAYTRRLIRKSDLTRAEKDVLIAVVNLWFYHRGGKKGFIHPGRLGLSKRANCSVITVARALSVFRGLGFISHIRYAKGGTGCATQYLVSLRNIWNFFDPDTVKIRPGELKFLSRETVSSTVPFDPQNDTVKAYQNDTLSIVYVEDEKSIHDDETTDVVSAP